MKDSMLYTLLMHGWTAVIALNTQSVWFPVFAGTACATIAVVSYLNGR